MKQSSGRVYGCDLFISATGVSPAGDLYRDEVGVDTDGVVVDHNMVTSDPDIYTAGDICSASWEPSERVSDAAFFFSTFIPDPVVARSAGRNAKGLSQTASTSPTPESPKGV